tara:strand:+ start:441 stop:650 length:210 start_codon:yes stop_codon:yes gene_type:complete
MKHAKISESFKDMNLFEQMSIHTERAVSERCGDGVIHDVSSSIFSDAEFVDVIAWQAKDVLDAEFDEDE